MGKGGGVDEAAAGGGVGLGGEVVPGGDWAAVTESFGAEADGEVFVEEERCVSTGLTVSLSKSFKG